MFRVSVPRPASAGRYLLSRVGELGGGVDAVAYEEAENFDGLLEHLLRRRFFSWLPLPYHMLHDLLFAGNLFCLITFPLSRNAEPESCEVLRFHRSHYAFDSFMSA